MQKHKNKGFPPLADPVQVPMVGTCVKCNRSDIPVGGEEGGPWRLEPHGKQGDFLNLCVGGGNMVNRARPR